MYKKFLFILIVLPVNLLAGTIDSLQTVLHQATSDSLRIELLINIGKEYITQQQDSAFHYLSTGKHKAQAQKSFHLERKATQLLAEYYIHYQEFDKALHLYQQLLDMSISRKDTIKVVDTYVDMSLVFHNINKKDEFLSYNQRALAYLGKKSWAWKGQIYSNIGAYYMTKPSMKDSTITYFNLALKEHEKNGMKKYIPHVYTNLGTYYYYLNTPDDYRKALENYQNAKATFLQNNDHFALATATLNIGYAYNAMNDFAKAEASALEAKALFTQQQDRLGIAECLDLLVSIYKNIGNYQKAFVTLDSLRYLDERIRGIEQQKALLDVETKYETVKKEKENERLQNENELKNEELKRQNIIKNSILFGLGMVIIITILIYIQFRNKKKANQELAAKNKEIAEKNEEIEVQRDQLEIQNEVLQEYMVETTDSINYAKRIQGAMLKSSQNSALPLPHFIFFQPKDIVSGDFYWMAEKNGYWYITAADCTGHGVPGAFMSMLGISFLNNIIKSDHAHTPAEMLNELRARVIGELGQSETTENKDGMDMALIRYNPKNRELMYAGANNSLYILSQDSHKKALSDQTIESEDSPYMLNEFKADKQPIGFLAESKDFRNHTFTMMEGEHIYLFSDGYADQFGGPSNKKLGYRSFKHQLLAIHQQSPTEQCHYLERHIALWMTEGNEAQVDDMCIIGIRI